ncbi:ATPase vacuolar ER assembly factor Vma12 [Pyrenophora seminiperda CCB06]|uniref:ATPase vacuolar ER assembly factor Vma12 n=1 Tax=Pyrenophora seminiperda CCB06 TaxID=1302712 RepID=A0A3M7LVH2_9PLEO|nr:ATPase vacuolar ER assembly factor Vma12 [Pyrenophora seminiperda CCB06]
MVLLTMTPGIARAVARARDAVPDEFAKLQRAAEPALVEPKAGNPIAHGQLIDLSKLLKKHVPQHTTPTAEAGDDEGIPTTLAALLRNTTIYTPPPPPKPVQTPEYQALMARLRAEQKPSRMHGCCTHRPPVNYSRNGFPASSEEDDVSYEEVHRQIILIINILVSIVCVAVFIWVAAPSWSVGSRLGLSMGGAAGIAIAEVAVYGGYVRKVREAKRLEKKKPEIKEIVKTWVLGEEADAAEGDTTAYKEKDGDGVRFRKGKHR